MKYAVVKTGGKQYKVSVGQILEVEKLVSDGQSVVFEEVLLVIDGDKVELGMPTVPGLKVYADVVAEVKGDKIEVFKYKSKSRYRKHTGHRQKYTQVKVTGIGVKSESKVEAPKKVAAPAKVAKAKKTVKAEKVEKPVVSAQGRSAVGGKKAAPKKTTTKKAAK